MTTNPTRWLVAALLWLLALGVFAASASAAGAGLDTSYGSGGAVALTQPAGVGAAFISALVGAPDGSAYALSESSTCGRTTCTTKTYLYRYTPSGALDGGFGTDGFVLLPAARRGYVLSVDAAGRAVVGALEASVVEVRRYDTAGNLEAGFGDGGTATIGCPCERAALWLLPAGHGRTLVESQIRPAGSGGHGGRIKLTRLGPDGSRDPSFGQGGTAIVGLGKRAYPGKATVTSGGAILLGSSGCCSGLGPYLMRVSATGQVDKAFGRAAARSLRRLRGTGELARLATIVARPAGTLDLLGNDPIRGGFDLRLRGDGRLAHFAAHGLRKLPFRVEAAVAGSRGAIFAVGSPLDGYSYRAFRLLGDGRLDPAFGKRGIAVPVSGTGISLARLGGGKVLVLDRGYNECRQGCPATPAIARFLEGPTGS